MGTMSGSRWRLSPREWRYWRASSRNSWSRGREEKKQIEKIEKDSRFGQPPSEQYKQTGFFAAEESMSFRHSKIVCTIGPASRTPRMIDRLLSAGMDVARLNFSHGTHEEHAKNISMLRAAAIEHEKPIAILADLQGPKIRTGPLAGGGPVLLRTGQRFVITTAKVLGDSTRVNTVFTPLPREVHRGDRILLSDGLIES